MNKLVIFSVLLSFVLIALDWNSRFGVEQIRQKSQSDDQEIYAVKNLRLDEEKQEKLIALYAPLFDEKDDGNNQENANPGMSAEDQLLQSGELTEVYVDNKKLTLQAVLEEVTKNETKTALLNVADLQGAPSILEAVKNGDNIYGFRLQVISSTRVDLFREGDIDNGLEGNIEPSISLVMYKGQS